MTECLGVYAVKYACDDSSERHVRHAHRNGGDAYGRVTHRNVTLGISRMLELTRFF